jgi:hypothetical protein
MHKKFSKYFILIQYAPKYTVLKCDADARVSVLYILAHTVFEYWIEYIHFNMTKINLSHRAPNRFFFIQANYC